MNKNNSFLDELLDWLKTLAVTFIVVILIFTFVARTARVNGHSMDYTLAHRDFLILWSLFYTPQNGDIIAANCEGLNEVIVKRIIAHEGQTVDIDFTTGTVTVDGVVLDEPYLGTQTHLDERGHVYPVTVPEGKYFVMGDNRMNSRDSRDGTVGFIDREDILGKAVLRVFPFSSFGLLK